MTRQPSENVYYSVTLPLVVRYPFNPVRGGVTQKSFHRDISFISGFQDTSPKIKILFENGGLFV